MHTVPRLRAATALSAAALVTAMGICLPRPGAAQGMAAPSVQHEEIPFGAAGGSCGRGSAGQLASTLDDLRFSFPLYRSGTVIVGNGLGWNHLRLRYRGFDDCFDPFKVSDLWSISYTLFMRISAADESSWLIQVSGHRSAEGYPTDPDAVRYTGGVVRTFKTAPETTWGLGAFFTYVLGAPRLLPGVTYSHRGNPWQVDVRLPFLVDAWYRTSEWLRVGAQTRFSGGQFALDRTDSPATDFRYSTGTAGIALALGRNEGAQVEMGAGYTFYRVFEMADGQRTVQSLTLENRPYGRARVSYRF